MLVISASVIAVVWNRQRGMVRQRDLDSFVARIWVERGTNGEPLWRGHVRHVQGEHEAYFQNLAEMSDFLEQVSGVPGPRTTVLASEDGEEPKHRARSGRKGQK
jgi:hypothetical protein